MVLNVAAHQESPYCEQVPFTLSEESVHSSGSLAIIHAAEDELGRRYGTGDDGPHMQIDELAPPRGFFLVARDHGHLAGGVGVRVIGDPEGRVGEVKRLWVRPDLRRSGVGRALMSEVLVVARSHGYDTLYLETGHAQPEAQALYPTLGWRRVEEFPPGAYSHPGAFRFAYDL